MTLFIALVLVFNILLPNIVGLVNGVSYDHIDEFCYDRRMARWEEAGRGLMGVKNADVKYCSLPGTLQKHLVSLPA